MAQVQTQGQPLGSSLGLQTAGILWTVRSAQLCSQAFSMDIPYFSVELNNFPVNVEMESCVAGQVGPAGPLRCGQDFLTPAYISWFCYSLAC